MPPGWMKLKCGESWACAEKSTHHNHAIAMAERVATDAHDLPIRLGGFLPEISCARDRITCLTVPAFSSADLAFNATLQPLIALGQKRGPARPGYSLDGIRLCR